MTAVQQAPAAGATTAPPAGPPPAAARTARLRPEPAGPPRRGLARALPRTVAARVRALTALIIVALVALLAVTWAAVANAREGVRVIGQDAGPQVVETGNLYFRLTDMDAQLANALITGRPGPARTAALARFDEDRRQAGVALLKAAKLADEDTENDTARDLLTGLGGYERLAGQALLLDQQSQHAPGPPPDRVLEVYRQASTLMKLDLLPKAYNLTLDNGTLVRHTYERKRSAVLTLRAWTLVSGAVLVLALAGLQVFLAVRFRRLLNPALALATLGTLVLVAVSAAMLSAQAGHLRTAKQDGFDSLLALSRTRAMSNSANADETRFLLDPGLADAYEQVFLSKSQTVLYFPAGNLTEYNKAIQQGLKIQPGPASFLGFLGTEAGRPARPGQFEAFAKVLSEYKRFQADDHRMRELVNGGQRAQAVAGRDAAAADYGRYDKALQSLIGIHQAAFDKAVRDGDDGTDGWYAVLPAAGAAIALLVLIGVRPRLAEYRFSK